MNFDASATNLRKPYCYCARKCKQKSKYVLDLVHEFTHFRRSELNVGAMGLGCWAIGGAFWDKGGYFASENVGALQFGALPASTMLEIEDVL